MKTVQDCRLLSEIVDERVGELVRYRKFDTPSVSSRYGIV
jgi:hypothetical protein